MILHASLSSTANRDLLQPSQHLHKIRRKRDKRWNSGTAKVTVSGKVAQQNLNR